MKERIDINDWMSTTFDGIAAEHSKAVGAAEPTMPRLTSWFTDDVRCNSALVMKPEGLDSFIWVVADPDGCVVASGETRSLGSACKDAMRHLPALCLMWRRDHTREH